MAISKKNGSFQLNTSTGNQAVTGLGFQPKAILFFFTNDTGDTTNAAHISQGYGIATSSTQRYCFANYSQNAQGNATERTHNETDEVLIGNNYGVWIEADFVSFDSDGFTINVTTAPAAAYKVYYVALGGSGLSAKAGVFACNTSTGDQSVTGLGFQPTAIFFMQGRRDTTDGQTTSYLHQAFGFSSGAGEDACLVGLGLAGYGRQADGYQENDACMASLNGSAAVDFEAVMKSFDSDGFTITLNSAPASAFNIFYLALSGVDAKVGSVSTPTSTGNNAHTGVGFQPEIDLFLTRGLPASASPSVHIFSSLGCAVSSTERSFITATQRDAGSSVLSRRAKDDTDCVYILDETLTVELQADIVTQDSDGFTLNYSTVQGSALELLYLSLKETAGGTAHTKTLTELLSLSDSMPKSVTRNLTESMSLVDLVPKSTTRPLSEQITLSDTRVTTLERVMTETLTLADILTRDMTRALTETLTLSDNLEAYKVVIKELTELLNLSDGLTRGVTAVLDETLQLDDTALKSVTRNLAESITLTDTLAKVMGKLLAEQLTLTDTAEKSLIRQLTEQVTLTDTCPKLTLKTLSELCTLADTLTSALVATINAIRFASQAVSQPGMISGALAAPAFASQAVVTPSMTSEAITI